MIRSRKLVSGVLVLAAAFTMHAGAALAGPAEDYQEGARRYDAGDLIAAMPPLRKAADAGHAAAQAMLAEILVQADSAAEAIAYYRKSAEQGNADGEFGYGAMLVDGEGAPKNLAEGRKWLLRAAEHGHKLAINQVALAYINGSLDIPEKDRRGAEALRWINTAAENGFVPAMQKLAAAYRSGELGLPADAKLAGQWDEKVRKALNLRQTRRQKRSSANEASSQ